MDVDLQTGFPLSFCSDLFHPVPANFINILQFLQYRVGSFMRSHKQYGSTSNANQQEVLVSCFVLMFCPEMTTIGAQGNYYVEGISK